MSLLAQPRGRADSIPHPLAETYRLDSSSTSSRPDADQDCALDCLADNSTSSSEPCPQSLSSPQDAAGDDEMLSIPHMDVRGDVPAPTLPAKSALRTSRLLASLAQKTTPDEDRPILPHAAPHQVYLSSEEDASSSADDLSELDELEWEAGDSQNPASTTRSSREDTARVVTVIFHGRPSLVELPPRTSYSGSTDSGRPATGILRTATEPTLTRTRSNSSSSSTAMYHAPRSSSMTSSGFQMKRRQFLTIDPFATKLPDLDEQDLVKKPKTPTGMLKKTLSLVKKRSRPTLSPAAGRSRENLVVSMPPMEQVGEEPEPESPRDHHFPNRVPVTYQGIMRGARRSDDTSTPMTSKKDVVSPTTTSSRSRFRSGLSISRSRSVWA